MSINGRMNKEDVVHTLVHIQCNTTQPREKKEILPSVATRMHLEGIILREISQTEKRQILYDLTYMWNPNIKAKSKKMVITRGWQVGECLRAQICNYKISPGELIHRPVITDNLTVL